MFDRELLKIPGTKAALAVCACASLADALVIYAQCAALASAIVGIWEGNPLDSQLLCAVAFLIFFVARKVIQNAEAAFMDRFASTACESLESRILDAIYIMGPAAAARYGTAALVNSLCAGMDDISEYLRIIIARTMAVLVVPLVLLICMFAYDWVSAAIALVMYPFIIIFMRLIGQGAKAEATRRHRQFERMSNNFLDTAAGVDTLCAHGAGPAFSESIFRASERFRRLTMRTLRIALLSSTVLDVFATLAIAAVAIMMGFRLVEGTLDFLPALLMLMLLPYYFQPIKDYGSNYHATLDGKTALDAATSLIESQGVQDADAYGDSSHSAHEENSAPTFPNEKAHVDGGPSLTLESVGFSHQSPDSERALVAISDVSLKLDGPCKVGVFGKSGAGKTTLLGIMAGFISPDSGSIIMNGTRTDTLRHRSWLRRVAYIPQSPYIFHASLRDNLAFYNPGADDRQIAQVAEAMGLSGLINELPDGLDTMLGKGGRELSGGQAQRVAVARALIDPARDIWILDEPTAHLDIETEYELKRELLPLMHDKLVVIATHRMHWKEDVDICVLMDDGSVTSITEASGGER